jgi:hypothetical protein
VGNALALSITYHSDGNRSASSHMMPRLETAGGIANVGPDTSNGASAGDVILGPALALLLTPHYSHI